MIRPAVFLLALYLREQVEQYIAGPPSAFRRKGLNIFAAVEFAPALASLGISVQPSEWERVTFGKVVASPKVSMPLGQETFGRPSETIRNIKGRRRNNLSPPLSSLLLTRCQGEPS